MKLLLLTLKTMAIFYTGSYTQEGAPAENPKGNGIGCFQLNIETGEVQLLHFTKQRSPSYLVISKNKKYLYAVEEMYATLNPRVYAYKILENGALSLINSQEITGDYACHLAIIKDRLVLANYVSGNALSYPILPDGSLESISQEIKHNGTGPNIERQEAAHAHMICPFGENGMYVVDLTLDAAKAYLLNNKNKEWISTPSLDIKIKPGSGSRHMVINQNEDFAYVMGELSGEISVVELQEAKSKIIQTISFIPKEHDGAVGGAAIRLHPNGNFLYATNRGSETITIFKIDKQTKKLEFVGYQSTEGKTPRDFNISATGEWLIAANQDSDNLVVFKIDSKTGLLKMKSKLNVNTPVNICWL
jgi:6-phosphogluconolactonase